MTTIAEGTLRKVLVSILELLSNFKEAKKNFTPTWMLLHKLKQHNVNVT